MGTKRTIDRSVVKGLFKLGFTVQEIAKGLGVSRVSVWRCLREEGLRSLVRKIAS